MGNLRGVGSRWLCHCPFRVRGEEGTLVHCLCALVTHPWTVGHQVPLFMEFSRQEYWSGLPFCFPGDLPDPGTKPGSPTLQADPSTTRATREALCPLGWVTQASSSMNFYPGDKFPNLGPLRCPQLSGPCAQACTRPDLGHTGLLQRPESPTQLPILWAAWPGEGGFQFGGGLSPEG